MQEYGIYLNIGTAVAVVLAISAGVRKFSLIEASVEAEKETRVVMEARIENALRDVKGLDRSIAERLDIMRHETGEMGAALRQKIHEVEMDSRDRMDNVASSIRESIERLGERLEGKIDKAMQRRDA